jgi:hypothetical protein
MKKKKLQQRPNAESFIGRWFNVLDSKLKKIRLRKDGKVDVVVTR